MSVQLTEPDQQLLAEFNDNYQYLDCLLSDSNGLIRGKRINGASAISAIGKGVMLPESIYGSTVNGETAEETGLGLCSR